MNMDMLKDGSLLEKKFQCPKCDYVARDSYHLKRHFGNKLPCDRHKRMVQGFLMQNKSDKQQCAFCREWVADPIVQHVLEDCKMRVFAESSARAAAQQMALAGLPVHDTKQAPPLIVQFYSYVKNNEAMTRRAEVGEQSYLLQQYKQHLQRNAGKASRFRFQSDGVLACPAEELALLLRQDLCSKSRGACECVACTAERELLQMMGSPPKENAVVVAESKKEVDGDVAMSAAASAGAAGAAGAGIPSSWNQLQSPEWRAVWQEGRCVLRKS